MGKSIIKIGNGPNGETVLFDSHDAIEEYEKRHKKVLTITSEKKGNYSEMRNDGRVYVFTSPARMDSFKKSGELGKGIIKVGMDLKMKQLYLVLMKQCRNMKDGISGKIIF